MYQAIEVGDRKSRLPIGAWACAGERLQPLHGRERNGARAAGRRVHEHSDRLCRGNAAVVLKQSLGERDRGSADALDPRSDLHGTRPVHFPAIVEDQAGQHELRRRRCQLSRRIGQQAQPTGNASLYPVYTPALGNTHASITGFDYQDMLSEVF